MCRRDAPLSSRDGVLHEDIALGQRCQVPREVTPHCSERWIYGPMIYGATIVVDHKKWYLRFYS